MNWKSMNWKSRNGKSRLALTLQRLGSWVAGAAMLLGAGASAQEADLAKTYSIAALEARQTHGSVDVVALGEGAGRMYAFLPAEPALKGPAPAVFFHHGWQGMDPSHYGALIDHLAREGNVVLFPAYQESDTTSPQIVVAATAGAERAMIAELGRRGITLDVQRVVYFGYSMGAAISLNLAVHAAAEHLPPPQALVLAAPGDAYHVAKGPDAKSIIPPMSALRPTLPVVIVTGAEDHAIGVPTGRKLAAALCTTAPDRKVFLLLPGDAHDGVTIHASHAAPGAPDTRYAIPLVTPLPAVPQRIAGRTGFESSASLNQLDFFGFWKVLDAVIDSLAVAPSSSPRYVPPAVVFRTGFPGQTYLGTWPDGTPYKSATAEMPCQSK